MHLYALNSEAQFHIFVHKMETGTPEGKTGPVSLIVRMRCSDRFAKSSLTTSDCAS